ncbi:hypothetical protein ACH5RR_029481 [Cinchona calisaya]|uniref:Uncharacterized protein n=1 Tax=Cinchona calisaya TaxID=153742 RepID=A0ABD2YRR9_9GENT
MAFTYVHSLSTIAPLFANPSSSYLSNQFPKLPLSYPKIYLLTPRCLPLKPSNISLTADQQEHILEAVAESNEELLPGVRTFENNSARLTLVGAVDFQQAVTAAAADGGRAAEEHVVAGLSAMVVETVFPGSSDDHSTISTRLFLPASKVKEKAKKLKGSLSKDILSSTTSESILAMTFRQVVLQQLWSFELLAFSPGTERNMDDLEKPREVPATLTISSSGGRIISDLAEVICCSALERVERDFCGHSFGRASTKFFQWFHKPKRFVSKDSSVILHKLLENEIVANANSLLQKFSSERVKFMGNSKNSWWAHSSYSGFERIAGPEFTAWISECIPLYRLQIDAGKFKDVKLEGGSLSAANIWEVLLTHSQMVCLASILDMYYEDDYTLPTKQFSCDAIMKPSNVPRNKSSSSSFKMLSTTLAGGLLLVTISILSHFYLPYLPCWGMNRKGHSVQSSCIRCIQPESLETSKLEAYCTSLIRKLKDSFDWPGEIMTETGHCAWTGELPLYLKRVVEIDSKTSDVTSTGTSPGERIEEMKGSLQEIASYQVVLSTDGKIVGFQPTSRVAVNNWASNPLAKELYAGRNLSPGFLEPGLKIDHPSDTVVLELLMCANPDSHFALVRPL